MSRRGCFVVPAWLIFWGLAAGCGASADADPDRIDASAWRPWVISAPSAVRVPVPSAGGVDRGPAQAAPDPVAPWIEHALRSVAQHTKNPPAASRTYGLISVAMHDATAAAAHWQKVHGRDGHPSTSAAIAGAASRVLADEFPDEPLARLDEEAQKAVDVEVAAGRVSSEAAAAGLALGREIAARVVARAAADRPGRKWSGEVPRGRGRWAPPPGSVARPVAPLAATWTTWLLASPAQMRPPPPPAYGSPPYVAAAREVVGVGRGLTPEQKRIARFWAGGEATGLPPGIWNQVALQIVRDRRLDPEQSVRLFALLNVAMADAGVAAWDAKYAYWTARPVNAVADLGLAHGWEPLLATPVFPSYPSGHATFSAAAAVVLGHLFPDQKTLFDTKAAEAAMSRLYGGVHFRFDNDAGIRMGVAIGRLAVARDKAAG